MAGTTLASSATVFQMTEKKEEVAPRASFAGIGLDKSLGTCVSQLKK
jgi:hypothetical protein